MAQFTEITSRYAQEMQAVSLTNENIILIVSNNHWLHFARILLYVGFTDWGASQAKEWNTCIIYRYSSNEAEYK